MGDTITYIFVDPKSMPSALPAEEDTPRTHGGPPQPGQLDPFATVEPTAGRA
ncbi:hypothetical protein [Streptomyces pristinaespiralis]|uniref:hypothetical protein n=1 Tax=Streptomyces pristinaespiralis TaxID=38300 RepID=UPI00384DE621